MTIESARAALAGTLVLAAAVAAAPAAGAQDGGSMRGFGLANVAVSTAQPERMARWYADVLGFRVKSQAPGVEGVQTYVIERDGVAIDLIKVPNQSPPEVPKDPPRHLETQGLRNLVFWVDDLAAADAHLKAVGVPLIWASLRVEGIGTSITAFRDPDGNLVALWQRRR